MFCRLVILRLLNCVTETIQVMEGHMLASPALQYNRYLRTPRLAEIFESTWQIVFKFPLPPKKKILSRANGDFEKQNKVLESSTNYY